MSQIFQFFEDAPNLKYVDINVEGPVVASSAKSRLTMKSISEIEITSSENLGDFLEQVELPSVVDLSVCFIDVWPGPTFHSFLSRSSCALTMLEFHESLIPQEEIVICLQNSACNTLESFIMNGITPTVTDMILRHLTYRQSEHAFRNPRLRTIKLTDIRSTDGLFADMVESRCPSTSLPSGQLAPAQLTVVQISLSLTLDWYEHREDWKRLREVEKRTELKIERPTDRWDTHTDILAV
ncbi:hypothetical protein C8R45DRAFT_975866 [Mycena sanguinolenta]|nr:hypothetical protein C8R45DRAFT_975866 [Mycena sanguinolenta]